MTSTGTGNVQNYVSADGTLHIQRLTIPPSPFWSAEFKLAYSRLAAIGAALEFTIPPPLTASRDEWAKFERSNDALLNDPLTRCKKEYSVHVEQAQIGGVRVGIISPEGGVAPENERRVLINLHGGGFVYFSGLMLGQLEAIPVAAIGEIKVITLDYRQAPSYRYPAATKDVEAVYRDLLTKYQPESVGIYGCSAGGVLTAQAVAWFQENGLPRPGAVGIFGAAPPAPPWPYGREGDSIIWASGVVPDNGTSDFAKNIMEAVSWYMRDADTSDPKAYPGISDAVLSRFPPTLLLVGSREAWLSSTLAAHARLLKLGVESALYVMEGGWHEAHILAVGTPEAHDANAYIAWWFRQNLFP